MYPQCKLKGHVKQRCLETMLKKNSGVIRLSVNASRAHVSMLDDVALSSDACDF